MAGKKGNKSHANKTSYPNQKDNTKHPNVVMRKFIEMINNSMSDDDILCFQDACISVEWRPSKIDYWVNKIPVFEDIKKDIQNIIISRVNKNALKMKFNATAAIWRMKQLGEKDSSDLNFNTNTGLTINVDSKKKEKKINDMLNEID